MDTAESFASRLRKSRERRGLSQDALARVVEVSKNTVARWEGGAVPSGVTIVRLADELGVSVRWLLTGTNETATAPAAARTGS